MSLFNKWFSCSHYDTKSTFRDLHRGGDGEVYFRANHRCRKCGKQWVSATEMPEAMGEASIEVEDD